MSDAFYGEIRMFAGPWAPKNWAFCDGQNLAIQGNEPLFSLLGITYGGDGHTTFALPDLRGRLPIHQGIGPGLSNYYMLGQRPGTETVTLTIDQLPSHNHPLQASADSAVAATPSPQTVLAAVVPPDEIYTTADSSKTKLAAQAVENTGGNQAHSNLMPALCLNFIICLLGTYPQRQ